MYDKKLVTYSLILYGLLLNTDQEGTILINGVIHVDTKSIFIFIFFSKFGN